VRFDIHLMKDSSVRIRANRVLKPLTSVIAFVYVKSAALAVPRLPRVVYMICVAALNKIAVLLLRPLTL
jgi:hypothetical protein